MPSGILPFASRRGQPIPHWTSPRTRTVCGPRAVWSTSRIGRNQWIQDASRASMRRLGASSAAAPCACPRSSTRMKTSSAAWTTRFTTKRQMSRPFPVSLPHPMSCPTRIGAMAFRSAELPLSMRMRMAASRRAAGGVGFDISCGVRTILTGLKLADIRPVQGALADALYREIPAGVGSKGAITLEAADMEAMLTGGARWAVAQGWGEERDLARIEEQGVERGARSECVSERAKERQRRQMGTLGSGNHYLEIQAIAEILDEATAEAFHLAKDDVVVTIHCGSRGLGHQIGSDYLKEMTEAAKAAG